MSKRAANWLLLVASFLAIALPILAALYLAHEQSLQEISQHQLAMVNDVLRRSDAAVEQAVAADVRLHDRTSIDPCSAEDIARMRDISLGSSYLQAVGHLVGDQILCSSLGAQNQPVDIGKSAFGAASGLSVRPSVDLGLGSNKRFLVLARDGYAAAIDPQMLVDVSRDTPDYSLGLMGLNSGLVLSRRGVFDPADGTDLRRFSNGMHMSQGFLIAVQRSAKYDTLAYSAVPGALVLHRLRSAAMVLVPLGVLLGSALALACFLLVKGQASLPAVLRRAIRKRQFVVQYQPIVDLASGRPVGVEALLHWPHADGTETSAEVFIPVAEQCGLIDRITALVVDQVALDAPRLLHNWPDGYVSINVSASDLHTDTLVKSLRKLIAIPGIEARNIMVEATEHSFVDPTRAENVVRQVREMGITVTIDDFGTGFCSLSYLTGLQTDYLKIDRTYVEAVGTDSVTNQVALHIIQVATTLGLKIIGEGVETEVQAEFLRCNGVKFAQGWLFAKAMPLNEILVYLAKGLERPTDAAADFSLT